jgi:hypothetical protein
MNKYTKGCLNIFYIIVGIVMIIIVSFIIYWLLPNKITFSDKPIDHAKFLKNLNFDNYSIPNLILNQPTENILYQAFYKESYMDEIAIYKIALKMNEDVQLAESMPLNDSDKEYINKRISYNKIEEGFNPKIKIPKNKKTSSGSYLTIYSQEENIYMNLRVGSYSISYYEIDHDGSASDLMIYDKESKILYYERQRYYGF